MRYSRSPAFKRLFRALPRERQDAVGNTLLRLDEVFRTARPAAGLGLKALRHGVWEVRAGLLDRVVFSRSGDLVTFMVVGTHDDIRRFLRRL